jgi:pyridoxine 5-phosphate synthase
MAILSVNVDHVATVREARKIDEPDPVAAAILAELAGAGGITCHLRGDRRHIQERDLRLLREVVRTRLNLELAVESAAIELALEIRPDMVTFVPERPGEVSTEGGLDLRAVEDRLRRVLAAFREREIRVSVFVDPTLDAIKAAHALSVDLVEINTKIYCEARTEAERATALADVINAVKLAAKLKLRVAAGHGLNTRNVGPLAALPEVEEFNIGHSIVGRAVLIGMERAVREMIEAIRAAGR